MKKDQSREKMTQINTWRDATYIAFSVADMLSLEQQYFAAEKLCEEGDEKIEPRCLPCSPTIRTTARLICSTLRWVTWCNVNTIHKGNHQTQSPKSIDTLISSSKYLLISLQCSHQQAWF
jgi:hypothetical protein